MVDHQAELQLARAIGAGDKAAFDTFFADYFPRLYRFVLARVNRDAMAAEDLTQQVLLRALRGFGRYRGEASLYTWLCQIARNELADYWARRSQEQARFAYPEDDAAVRGALESLAAEERETPDRQHARSELARLVQVALDSLPTHYANALEWKYVDGYSVEEIAVMLKQGPVATQSILARARQAFRESFAALGFDSLKSAGI